MTNAEAVKRLGATLDTCVREVLAIIAANGRQRPGPSEIDALREAISRAVIGALDIGIWYDSENQKKEESSVADTVPGFKSSRPKPKR